MVHFLGMANLLVVTPEIGGVGFAFLECAC